MYRLEQIRLLYSYWYPGCSMKLYREDRMLKLYRYMLSLVTISVWGNGGRFLIGNLKTTTSIPLHLSAG